MAAVRGDEDDRAETAGRDSNESGLDEDDSNEDRAPLSDLVESVVERRERGREDHFYELFSDHPEEEMTAEQVWDGRNSLNGEDGASTPEFGAVGAVDAGVEGAADRAETYVVSKRTFCERCRHFSDPPEARCTHPEAEIREFVDADHVRVYSCPVVEDRRLADPEGANRHGTDRVR